MDERLTRTGVGGEPPSTMPLSVVSCLRDGRRASGLRRHIRRTAGCPHECVFIDNGDGRYGLCAAYNEGVRRARGDIVAFVHDDARFLETGWGRRLADLFAGDASLGLVGVAGAQVLARSHPWWPYLWDSFAVSRVFHEHGVRRFPRIGRLRRRWVALRNPIPPERLKMEAVAVDGVFMAVRASLFERLRFDDDTFRGFHMYDADLCMAVRRTHRVVVVPDLFMKHWYRTDRAKMADFKAELKRFADKYTTELPASVLSWDEVRARLARGSGRERRYLALLDDELRVRSSVRAAAYHTD